MNQDIKKAILEEFAANDFRLHRRDDVIARARAATHGTFYVSAVRDTFNTLVAAGFIFRRGGWYVKAARPAPQPEPERPATPPPALQCPSPGWVQAEVRKALGAAFPMALSYNKVRESLGSIAARVGDEIHEALELLVQKGVVQREGENIAYYRLVDGTAEPTPTPSPTPPARSKEYDAWAGAHPVVGTEAHTLVNATSEALCREVVWRLATGRLPDALVGALAEVSYWAAQQGKKGD